MLVLTRKTRETIQISDNISVTVLRIHGNSVRIGIDAPRHIRIVRGEIPLQVPGLNAPDGSGDKLPTHQSATPNAASDSLPSEEPGLEETRGRCVSLLACESSF